MKYVLITILIDDGGIGEQFRHLRGLTAITVGVGRTFCSRNVFLQEALLNKIRDIADGRVL